MLRSVRFYSVSTPWPESEQELSGKLATAAFRPCGTYTERSSGFEPPTGTEDAPLARRVGGADLLRVRNQVRVLPTAAVNEALEVRLAEYRQRMQEEPGRRTKRKLKEQTRDELLPKALLKSDRTTALYLLQENVLCVGTASENRAERFLEQLRGALGKLDTKPLAFERPASELLNRLFAGDPPPKFALGRECRMRDRAEAKSTVRWQDVDLTGANVRKCVKDGMELTHLGFEFGGVMSGVLDANCVLGKFKLLDLEEPPDEAAEDPLARFDAELTLLGGTLRQLVGSLKQALDRR
ncbi:MAG TPA: recombination-associated protein RdgC [Gammaproteobacteria bacterium]|nr:recombination-associated protein RdgC [Gammaproteobacteria bacterium]